ncbi:MAG TPA: DUF4124 domain-containing protein [Ramlibacter sp.]|nr:DUF4124 domain-containing protein [Ramlibacter sp.]
MHMIHRASMALFGAMLASQAGANSIYVCVDAQGRRLTSDRPILECLDREQRELNASGTVRRTVPPSPTAVERAALDAKAQKELDERNKVIELRQRNRALLTRFPNQGVLDRERTAALATVNDLIATATLQTASLVSQRAKLNAEAAKHGADAAKAPAALRRSIEHNEEDRAAQERFIAGQMAEKQRVNTRFDDMQKDLLVLWAQMPSAPTYVVQPVSAR